MGKRHHSQYKLTELQRSIMLIVFAVLLFGIAVITAASSGRRFQLKDFIYGTEGLQIGYVESGGDGIFAYGPYVDLDKGNYEVELTYESDYDTQYDVVCKDDKGKMIVLAEGNLVGSEGSVVTRFFNEERITNDTFEIRVYYPSAGAFQLKSVEVHRYFDLQWYMLSTVGVIILTVLFVWGERRRKCFTIAMKAGYISVFYLCIVGISLVWSMLYQTELERIYTFVVLNMLIILHGYGMKKRVYRFLTAKRVCTVVSYLYMGLSLWVVDVILRYITSEATEMGYWSFCPNMFTLAFIIIVATVVAVIPKTWIKRLVYGLVYYLFLIISVIQIAYYQVYRKLFSFKDIMLLKEGSDYSDYIMSLFTADFIGMIILFILFGVIGILLLKNRVQVKKVWYAVPVAAIIGLLVYNSTFYTDEYGEWNSFENDNYIYATMTDRVGVFELCGLYQYELKDLKLSLFGNGGNRKDNLNRIEEWHAAKEASDADVESRNNMQSVFEGKNVVFVLMESIDDIALNEEVMPTLYQMSQRGISFNNMYASIFGTAATMNSEMVTNVGLYAPLDGSMVYSFADNLFPYSLANLFTENGYTARQFHHNEPTYYSRMLMNKAFGYKEYVCYADYTKDRITIDDIVTRSEDVFEIFTQDEPFYNYIITYSAHLPYEADNVDTAYAIEKYPEYQNMTDSQEINNYMAKARLTDDLFKSLIAGLREKNLLKDTIIVAVGDHYPYGIKDTDTLYELSGVKEYDKLLQKVPCVIWGAGVEPMQIDKVCSTIDVVPTVANICGLADPDMYVGENIFDDSYEGIAYFSDGSWITGDVFYQDGKLITGQMDEADITRINEWVMEKISVNDAILSSDYYRYRE